MPRFNPNAMNFCYYPHCNTVFTHSKEKTRHFGHHDIYEGHKNPFICEVCNKHFYRIDTLNLHRRTHDFRVTSRRNCVTITDYEGMNEEGLGIFNARYVNHRPNLNRYGKVEGWMYTEVGESFQILSS